MKLKRARKPQRSKKILLDAAAVTLSAVLLFSVVNLIRTSRDRAKGIETYEELRQVVVTGSVDVENTQEAGELAEGGSDHSMEQQASEENIDRYRKVQTIGADFGALNDINSDVVAWISIPGTKLDYPVTQCSDNSYYLDHLFTGESNVCGCVFLDCRNSGDFSSRHSVIYGHRMNDGTMFSCVQNYKAQSYYEGHPTATLCTPSGNYTIEFFSGYVTEASGEPWKLNFSSDEDYSEWIDSILEKSDFEAGVTPSGSDRVITFSTCSHAFENARYVLHGIIRNS